MRRDKDDKKWKALKEFVSTRDRRRCQFAKNLIMKDFLLLQKYAPSVLLNRIDHAHVFPVGLYPHMCYIESNVVLLNRWTHHNLDSCRHPITGEDIKREERDSFWKEIIGESRYERLLEKSKEKMYE